MLLDSSKSHLLTRLPAPPGQRPYTTDTQLCSVPPQLTPTANPFSRSNVVPLAPHNGHSKNPLYGESQQEGC